MPSFAPPAFACGVQNPIWLKGVQPTDVGIEKTLQACVRVGKKDCAKSWQVKVKKCSQNQEEFYLYFLTPVPGCPMRYCAGTEQKCAVGESSPTGFTPGCTSKYPKLKKDPVIDVGVSNKRIRFACKIDPVHTDDNVRHEVTWYQGPPEKKISKTDILKGGETEAYLQNTNNYGDKPLFCLGENMYCKVRSFFAEDQSSNAEVVKSPARKSNEFFAGIKVEPKEIDLSEKDKPKKIRAISTLPIICQDGTENCKVTLEIAQNKEDNFFQYCELKFQPGPGGQVKEVEVVAKRDFVDDGNQEMFLKLTFPDQIDPVDWNCHKNITNVKIKTKSIKTSRCTSTGDPHLTTFDGLYYNLFSAGDYVMVESSARKFKVHARSFRCHTVACNCGIAAQEGDDVVVIDMCKDNVPRARYASKVEPQKGTSISRNANGKSFVITFPSGAFIQFDVHKWRRRWYYANVVVQVPSDDYQSTRGLCGTFDQNKKNDLLRRDNVTVSHRLATGGIPQGNFLNSWKLSASDSLFYYRGGKRECSVKRARTYCTCKDKRVNCNFEGYSQRPKYTKGFRGWKKLSHQDAQKCGKRKRRSVEDDDEIILPDDGDTGVYDYKPEVFTASIPVFPTSSGITKQSATKHCNDKLRNSGVGKACFAVIGATFDVRDIIEQCILDVQVSDDYSIGVDSGINNLVSACEELTLRDVKFWKKDSSSEVSAPPAQIAESLCPNECSGNGVCQNATCVCNSGYITADCSMKKGQAPVLIGLLNNGLCDIRAQDCVRVRVMGYDYIDTKNLYCRSTEVQISGKPYVKTTRVNKIRGQLLSFAEISCLLPSVPVSFDGDPATSRGKPVGGYLIGVSNDAVNYSKNDSLLIVYDSKCMECTKTGDRTCKWKTASCKISEYCFAPDDPNPSDWCQVCDPAQSRTSFVKRRVNYPPKFSNVPSMLYPFKGQKWEYTIPASDPEKRPLKYEFLSETHGMQIAHDGVLTWLPNEISSYTFHVKVTDPCGLSASQKFLVETKQCPCEGMNGGVCKWVGDPATGGNATCVCPDGCTGERCEDPIIGRVCKIRLDKQIDDGDSKSSNGGVIVAVILLLLLIVVAYLAYVIFSLKKRKQEITLRNMWDFTTGMARDAKKRVTNAKKYQEKGEADKRNSGFVKSEVTNIENRVRDSQVEC